MNERTRNIIFVFLLLFVVCFMTFVVYFLYSNMKALKNPFIFGASQMGGVHCDCIQITEKGSAGFHFNDTSWWKDKKTTNYRSSGKLNIEDWEAFIPEE